MALNAYHVADLKSLQLTEEQVHSFWKNGYILLKGLFKNEIQKLDTACSHQELRKKSYTINDPDGCPMRMALWQHPGNDFLGKVARCDALVNAVEKIFNGEVYHYHTKLMMKEAEGGGIGWHQDYGYWYQNGCLKPDMGTVFIAIDDSFKENGCLQVLRGSHKLGRINHTLAGGQTGADDERMKQILKHGGFPLEFIEQKQGDTLIFHCNLLHRSFRNESKNRRYMLSIAYNMASNDPVYVHHHPNYVFLEKVSVDEVRNCTDFFNETGKEFINPSMDKTVRGTEENDEQYTSKMGKN